MAYALDPNQQQNQQNPAGPSGSAGAPNQPVPTSGAPGSGPTGSKTPTGTPSNQQTAQPFTNLQAYLSANAPQIQNQANTIASGLTNQYGKAQGDIASGANAFSQQVTSGFTPENAPLVQQAAANPTQFVQTPGNTQAFQSQINDQYTGPTNFESTPAYGTLNNEVTQDAANANLVSTPAGLQTYLQQGEVNPTQGENLLDSVLLQSSPQAIQQVTNAATPFAQLPTYLANDVTAQDALAAAAPAAATQAATDAKNAFVGPNGVAPIFQNYLNNNVTAANTNRDAYNAAINQNAAELNPINTDLASFNASTGYGVANPLTPYLSQQPVTAAPSLSTVSSVPQYSEDAALQQLLGTLYNPSLDQANIGQAGTFSVPTALSPDVQSLVDQLANSGTTPTYNQFEPLLAPNAGFVATNAPAQSKQIAENYPNGQGFDQPNIKAYEALLQALQPQSGGYIIPQAFGPNFDELFQPGNV